MNSLGQDYMIQRLKDQDHSLILESLLRKIAAYNKQDMPKD